jgi:hypothetical protein
MGNRLSTTSSNFYVHVAVLMLLTVGAMAQVESGRFVGRISDSQGAVIAQASVSVKNVGTNITQTAVTDSDGNYVITPVSAGVYVMTVSAAGFSTSTTSNIVLQVGQTAREDLQLKVGATSTTVQVTAEIPLLSTDTATIGTVVTNRQLTDLPLNGRGFFRLAELTPGAALLPATGNSLPIRPEIVNGNTISGIRGSAVSFLLDGVDVSEQHQGGTFIQTSIDALQEFSVQQSPYSAEYNRGGAFFNAATKSGANQLHGGLFEFFRNDKLDAANYFSKTRAILRRNQFGGDLGGPISIPHLYNGTNKTFFFLDYEAQRLRQGLVVNNTVPTDAERSGDFTGRNIIFDPLTPGTRTQISCNGVPNVICPDRISDQAKAVMAFIPRANSGTNSFLGGPSQAIDFDQFTVRVDHQIKQSNRLFVRWAYVNNREVDPNAAPQLGTASLTSNAQDIAVGLITNIGPNKVQDFRIHYLPSHVRLSAFLQGPDFLTTNGITGFTSLLRPGTGGSFPDFSFSGYSALQGSAFDQRPKSQDRTVLEPTYNFTILTGRHSLKFGALFRYYQWLGYDSSNYSGIFNFTSAETQALPDPVLHTPPPVVGGDAFADFLLGFPASVARAYPADNFGGQRWYQQYFAQDDIRVNDRLTLNIGLRYEYSPWLNGYKGQLGTFDPTQAKPIIVESNTDQVDLTAQFAAPAAYQFFGQFIQTSKQAGLPYSITYTDKTQFAPRFGFAYRPFGKDTVIRGGYGIFYEPEGTSGRVNRNILPFLLAETVNQTANVVPTRTLGDFFLGSQLGSALANPSLLPTKTHLAVGQNQHYSFGLQQQLGSKTVFDIAYVGNHGLHLQGTDDFNDPLPGPGSVQSRRPYQPWGSITFQSQDVGITYQSLQTKLEHRTSGGFTGLVAYTWSKLLQSNQSPQLGGNTGYEKTYSAFDIPQNLAMSGTYELPIGKGKRLLGNSSKFVSGALGGWQLQSIIVLRSGAPYTPVVSSDRAGTGVGNQRPNFTAADCTPNFHPTIIVWFDKACYNLPAHLPASGTYGQVRAFTLRSDMFRQYDASLFKNFHVTEGSTLSFRAEFFNLPNTTSFNAPNATVDAAAGGRITSTSIPSRDIQLAVKYNF